MPFSQIFLPSPSPTESKRRPSEWEKIIANEATDKQLISKIYKQLLQLNSKLWKILNRLGVPHYFTCLLGNLYAGQEATIRTEHEQQTGSKSGKEYIKAAQCHLAYLTYMQSTS